MTRPLEGTLLDGRYRVEGPDADGYAATDLTSGKRVHIAFIPRTAVHGARRAMQLVGAHVVRVLDVGETPEGAAWLAREHVSSVSLTKHLARRGPLPVKDAIEVALAVCDAVAEANALGLFHGALDASCVYLAFSASGLVDVQVAGIGSSAPAKPRDDVRSIAKLIGTAIGQQVPTDLAQLLERVVMKPCRVLDFAQVLVPFAFDPDFAADRIATRKQRSSGASSVIADGAYPEELAPAVRDLKPALPKPAEKPIDAAKRIEAAKPRARAKSYGRDLPTIIARRPAMPFPRRRAFRIVGIVAAALTVALLVLIGTEGARLMHPKHEIATLQRVEPAPLPAQAPIAPPVALTAEPSATPIVTPVAAPIPVLKPTDLPSAKPSAKKKR